MEVLPVKRESSQQQRQTSAAAATRPLRLWAFEGCVTKAFDVAMRSRQDNGFKRAYHRALEQTHEATHARLTVQRKIVSTLRAMWLTMTPYCNEVMP